MDVSDSSDANMSEDESSTNETEHTSAPDDAAAAAVAKVKEYFAAPETWLDGATAQDAVDEISNVEFEVARLLDEDAGEEGRRFKESTEYAEGLDKLTALKRQHEAAAGAAAATRAAQQSAATASANADSPLGPYGALVGLISDVVLADERNFKVLLAGLRSEESKGEHEEAWKAAGLALYQRRASIEQARTGLVTATFDQVWAAAVDRRLDARVITHYARLSDAPAFLKSCQAVQFGDGSSSADKDRSHFSEVELRDYYLLAYGDNVVRIHQAKGTAMWWRGKWKWDKSDRTLQFLVMRAVRDLYNDLLAQHRDRRTAVENDADLTREQKAEEDDRLGDLITRTAKALSAYGNRRNKDVTDLILQHLIADEHEVDPFDEDRLLFAFTNKVYNLKTHTFAPHFKFDYVLTNCGREWREPTAAQLEKVRTVIEAILSDADERKTLVSVLRNGLSGVRPELFVILTGEGRNGKSLLVEWIQFLLGAYAMEGKITTLTEKPKSGPDTELANQHKKRIVIYSEPEEAAHEALRLGSIKLLTGNETVNARGLHDSRDKTQMHAVQVLECNKLPTILGDKGESARERVLVQHFPFTFTNDAAKLASDECATDDDLGITLTEKKYKPKDESLKSRTFKEDHYCAIFKYLVDTDRVDAEDGVGIHIAEKTKQRAGKYLDANDVMPMWVSEHYDDADESEKSFVTIKDLYHNFKTSEHYQNLSKRERTLMNEKKFRSAISKSAKYKPKYREKEKVRLSDGKYNTKDGFVNLKKKSEVI